MHWVNKEDGTQIRFEDGPYSMSAKVTPVYCKRYLDLRLFRVPRPGWDTAWAWTAAVRRKADPDSKLEMMRLPWMVKGYSSEPHHQDKEDAKARALQWLLMAENHAPERGVHRGGRRRADSRARREP
jgi:hypothetical protein